MDYFVLSLGANLGDRLETISRAKEKLEIAFGTYFCSSMYRSQAVEYLDQPDFINCAMAFKITESSPTPEAVLSTILDLEDALGRVRSVRFGPRVIDIDLIFYSDRVMNTPQLTLPHPRFLQRSFVVRPMLELPIKEWLSATYSIPDEFETEALIVD
tara:strand:+ start:7483 stop:7953 length:471 start_codon:yes stop_codon:yes gene_type:complete